MEFFQNLKQGYRNFKNFLSGKTDSKGTFTTIRLDGDKRREIAIRQLAFEMCVQRISRTISKCEFQTFDKGKAVKKDWYYLLNVRPNPNQSASEFWDKFIHKLYYNNEALIVQFKDSLFVADSFTASDEVLKGRKFSDVTVDNFTWRRSFGENEAFYFRMDNEALTHLWEETTSMCIEMMVTASKAFKRANGLKYKLHIRRQRENKDDKDKKIQQAMNESLKTFIESDDAVWLENEGFELIDMNGGSGGTSGNTRDIKALLDDVLEITCKAFLIPTNIMSGEVTDTGRAIDDFLTFCLDGVVEIIQDGINSKKYEPKDYLNGSQTIINSKAIKHIDVLDMAGAVEKLISSSVYTVNEVRKILGEATIDEPWANEHFITKNFTTAASLLFALMRGGSDEPKDEPDELPNGLPYGSQSEESGGGNL